MYTYEKPDADRPSHWTHDDNMQSQSLGWVINNVENTAISELMSLRRGVTAYDIFENEIKPKFFESAIHQRAFIRCQALKMQFPNHKFLFETPPPGLGGREA